MNLPRYALESFIKFSEDVLGLRWMKDVPLPQGELKRTMIKDRLLIIREHENRRTEDQIEIFCSDVGIIREIEEDFLFWCQSIEDNAKVDSEEKEKVDGKD